MTLAWQTLDKHGWQQWLKESEMVEQDAFGPKVLRCKNGEYIKIFRIKHKISLARLRNPAARFCRNAEKLRSLGIDTLTPLALYRIPHLDRWAVHYAPLAGDTLRGLLKHFSLPEKTIGELGRYIAHLHDKGVYFRSLHPGNIVLQPDGKLGLIDVLDCRFRCFGRPLNEAQRERNFRHFFRYEDGKLIEAGVRAAYGMARQT
jgi:tRNA A-37 threonylcarbamoyl transferase component Bud32